MTKDELVKKIEDLENSIGLARTALRANLPLTSIHGIMIMAVRTFLDLTQKETMEIK